MKQTKATQLNFSHADNSEDYLHFSVKIDNISIRVLTAKVSAKTDKTALHNDKNLHFHPYFEVFFVCEEPLLLVTPNGTYTHQNCVLIVPPSFQHYAVTNRETISFTLDIQDDNQKHFFTQFLSVLPAGNTSVLNINEHILRYLNDLRWALNSLPSSHHLKIEPLITLLILHISDLLNVAFQECNPSTESNYLKYISQIELLLNQSFFDDMHLSHFAEKLFLSERQVSRIIKKAYNCTFSELITNHKLNVSTLLLKNTRKPIAEIIQELNFNTESYFFVLFKKKYGCTPLAYRKQFQNK